MAKHEKRSLTTATRGVTLRDFVIFQLKLFLDGAKDWVVIPLSIAAVILDMLAGKGRRPRLFYSVVRLSERFDLWINLHGVAEHVDETDDGLFGASKAGSNSLLGQIEQVVRGGDTPRHGKVKGGDPRP